MRHLIETIVALIATLATCGVASGQQFYATPKGGGVPIPVNAAQAEVLIRQGALVVVQPNCPRPNPPTKQPPAPVPLSSEAQAALSGVSINPGYIERPVPEPLVVINPFVKRRTTYVPISKIRGWPGER